MTNIADSSGSPTEAEQVAPANPNANRSKPAPARKIVPAGRRSGAGHPAKTVAAVRVNRGPAWGTIVLYCTAGVLALAIVALAGYLVYEHSLSWQDHADRIDGVHDYRKTDPSMVAQRSPVWGPQTYQLSPPVAGDYNPNWMRCLGDVYPAPIANEHALHSLELGAVWITYNPSLPAGQVRKLADKVRDNDDMLMSPYPGLDKPISLQAWGFQLRLDNADDNRIDKFIKALRHNAALEAGASCSTGNFITETGTTPHDLGKVDGTGTGN